jgi:hypothetical protein
MSPNQNMKLKLLLTILLTHFTFLIASAQFGQQQLWQTQMMRMGDSFIRVAEPGQVADTVHVWGDVTVPGNYIVPKGSSVTEIISYARGPARTVANVVQLDWSQLRMDVILSHYNPETKQDEKVFFQYKYNQALVPGIRTKIAQNRDVIVVEVKRKPVLVDWLGVIGPVISAVTGIVSLYIILTR